MRVVYFGSDVFLSCFEYFVQRHQVLALYTYHNDEDYFTEYAIVRRAEELGIPVHYESITPQEIMRYFVEDGCELFFIAEYDRILTLPDGLAQFRGINTHSSLLPQGRSYYPIEAAMQRGLARTGVTMHKLSRRLDGGDILAQRTVELDEGSDSVDAYLRCAAQARGMLGQLMSDFDAHWAAARPQKEQLPYWRRPDAALLTLRHDMTRADAREVFRRYNAMTEVRLDGARYHVTALDSGPAQTEDEVRFLSPARAIYRVADGHLRLHIHPMEVEP